MSRKYSDGKSISSRTKNTLRHSGDKFVATIGIEGLFVIATIMPSLSVNKARARM